MSRLITAYVLGPGVLSRKQGSIGFGHLNGWFMWSEEWSVTGDEMCSWCASIELVQDSVQLDQCV